jgi:hypothetical protein
MSQLLDLLVQVVKFGLEVFLFLLEDFCVFLLTLARCESVMRVRRLGQQEDENDLRCFSVS